MPKPAVSTTASNIFTYISVGAQLIWFMERAVATLTRLVHYYKSDLQKTELRSALVNSIQGTPLCSLLSKDQNFFSWAEWLFLWQLYN